MSIHWKSNHSQAVKLGVSKGLIHRAHLLSDLKEDLLDELKKWSSKLKQWAAESFGPRYDNNEYFKVLHVQVI